MSNMINLKNSYAFQIIWDTSNGKTYKYGANLSIDKKSVIYQNPLMAQAVKIHTWFSQTDYPNFRFSPALPLLKSSHHYVLVVDCVMIPENSVFIQLDFFNILNEKVNSIVADSNIIEFIFPKEATHYEISIVNASNQFLKFEKILLFESTNNFQKYAYDADANLIISDRNQMIEESVTFNSFHNQILTFSNLNGMLVCNPLIDFLEIDSMLNSNNYQPIENMVEYINTLSPSVKLVGHDVFSSILAIIIDQISTKKEYTVCTNFRELIDSGDYLNDVATKKVLDWFK
ncbi:accessory Sec system protein Asp3 [Leuconostoc palmae]|uniref:accessory Sec system protein Asp3 n=1 Tax=Leuconostoc palmae TaxID=501487 RepID=UPI001C7D8170|nr:accessory Sec system protein Asp3 [Leuconostoc palmae]